MTSLTFKSRAQAKKVTGLCYLGSTNSSAKIIKNSKVKSIDTYILYLSPWKSAGIGNTCPMATAECITGCLNTSGRAKMELNSNTTENKIINARIAKTKLFYQERAFFMGWLVAEIEAAKAKAEKKGNEFAIRLNGTSDIDWRVPKIEGKNIFEIFPTVQFYDYTKVPKRFIGMPENYHLTFSYTGLNWEACKSVLYLNGNVAMVFNLTERANQKNKATLPKSFDGFPIIDADITDYRPDDNKGSIGLLRWKEIANKVEDAKVRQSVFVTQMTDPRLTY